MIRTLSLLSLLAVLLCGCKPTERTALKKKHLEQTQAPAVVQPAPEPQPAVTAPEPIPAPVPQEAANSLLLVSSTLQEYNPMRPWEKDAPRQRYLREIGCDPQVRAQDT